MVVDVDDLAPSLKTGGRWARGQQRSAATESLADAAAIRGAVLYLMSFHGCTGV